MDKYVIKWPQPIFIQSILYSLIKAAKRVTEAFLGVGVCEKIYRVFVLVGPSSNFKDGYFLCHV